MKTMNTTMRAMMMVLMAAVCMNMSAQRRGGDNGRGVMGGGRHTEVRGGGRGTEMRGGNHRTEVRGGGRHGNVQRGGGYRIEHRGGYQVSHRPVVHCAPRPVVVHHAPHHIPARWAHCVRYMPDGRWGYYRDNCWYYYSEYYEPDYYFAHPVAHFHSHCLGNTVVAAAATTVAVASLINALMH